MIQAFAEGRTIQVKCETGDVFCEEWEDTETFYPYETSKEYRVKPEPKRRPFRNTEECWQEMQKHQPFGWIMRKGHRYQITSMTDGCGVFCEDGCDNLTLTGYLHDGWTFTDGTPFGVKEE